MQYLGITYNISSAESVEYASKIGTINNSIYPLIDAHNIDWDTSQLSKIAVIPNNAFELFARNTEITPLSNDDIEKLANELSEKRIRYKDDEDYKNVATNATPLPPSWYMSGRNQTKFSNSGEVLDLLDYYAWITSFNYERIKHLYDIQEGTIPVLKFRSDEVEALGAMIDYSTFNIEKSYPIVFTLKPNQTHDDFKNVSLPHFDGQYRIFNLIIFGEANNSRINDSSFYNRNGSTTLEIGWLPDNSSEMVQPPYTGYDIKNAVTISGNAEGSGYGFDVEFRFDGWSPSNHGTTKYANKWDDVAYGQLTFKTKATNKSATKQYAESAVRLATIKIKKDTNIYDYIFINDERYIYLEEGFFNNIKNSISDYYDTAFIIQYSYLNTTTNIAQKFIDDPNLYKYLVRVSNPHEEKGRLTVPNNKPLVIEIYPKYYGDAVKNNKGEYVLLGEKDLKAPSDKPVEVFAEVISIAKDNSAVNHPISKITKTVHIKRTLDGIERDGFRVSFENIEQELSDYNIANKNCWHRICVGTEPTNFVSSMTLIFTVLAQDSKTVWFIDGNRRFNWDTANYASGQSTGSLEKYGDVYNSMGVKVSTVKHTNETGKDVFSWDLTLPLFTERSWQSTKENFDTTNLISQIRPAVLGNNIGLNDELKYPSYSADFSDVKKRFIDDPILQFEADDITKSKYAYGFPYILIGRNDLYGSLGNTGNYLLDARLYGIRKSGTTEWINVSDRIEIDYKSTFEENYGKDKFLDPNIAKSIEKFKPYFDSINKDYDEETAKLRKGKVFVNRYCAIEEEEYTTGGIIRNLVFYRPTVPDDQISENFEDKTDVNNRKFKLILQIPKHEAGSDDAENPIYEGQKLTVNLMVERAKNELAGWASKQSATSTAGTAIRLEIGKDYKYSKLVSYGKTTDPNNGDVYIFTRLTTLYIPITNSTTGHYNVITTMDQLNSSEIKYYYSLNTSEDKMRFYSKDQGEKSDFLYKIDENNSLTLLGNMNSDEHFRGVYDGTRQFSFSIQRKKNPIVGPKSIFGAGSASNDAGDEDKKSNWVNADAATVTELVWDNNSACGVIFSGLKYIKTLQHNKQQLEDFSMNVFGDLCIISTGNTQCYFYRDIYKGVRDDLATQIPSFSDELHQIDLQRVSLTINLSKYESNIISDNQQFLNIWNSAINANNMSIVMNGKYVAGKGQFDTDSGITFADNDYNKVYIDDESTVYHTNEMVTIDQYGKIKFKDNFINIITKQENGIYKYKTIKIKAVALLPMTDEYQGYACIANFIIPLNA